MFATINYYFSDTNFLEIVNTWVLKDKIKRGLINIEIGDEVVCFDRKANGHPRAIEDGIIYTVKNTDIDGHVYVAKRSKDGVGWMQQIRVHKTYIIPQYILRDIKLNNLLSETNQWI